MVYSIIDPDNSHDHEWVIGHKTVQNIYVKVGI